MNIESLQIFLNNLRIEHILFVFVTYLLILWLLVPIWVYIDSKKKFHSNFISIVFALLVLPFNIPGVIFYIIIRPDENSVGASDDSGIINIPIANFTSNKDEVIMGLEIKINGNLIDKSRRNDINLNVSIDSDSIEQVNKEENKLKSEKKQANIKARLGKASGIAVKGIKNTGKNIKNFLFAGKKSAPIESNEEKKEEVVEKSEIGNSDEKIAENLENNKIESNQDQAKN